MRVAVCQLNARDDRPANLAQARELLERAAAAGADLAVLPEFTDYLGPSVPPGEPLDGDYTTFFAKAAQELGMWVLAGSFHESIASSDERSHNTAPLFDRTGALVAAYRKIHLYDVEIPGRVSFRESATIAPGTETIVADVEGVRVGLSTCYDLRFPELYRRLAIDGGAQVILVPAAFMLHTGKDHWEVLLRARAIENQCYVVAAGQIGDHDPGRTCYGRSMVIDPWGTVIAQAPDTIGITVADLDLDRLARIRQELPSLTNRRLWPA
jgi:deaminated glutathione amidase